MSMAARARRGPEIFGRRGRRGAGAGLVSAHERSGRAQAGAGRGQSWAVASVASLWPPLPRQIRSGGFATASQRPSDLTAISGRDASDSPQSARPSAHVHALRPFRPSSAPGPLCPHPTDVAAVSSPRSSSAAAAIHFTPAPTTPRHVSSSVLVHQRAPHALARHRRQQDCSGLLSPRLRPHIAARDASRAQCIPDFPRHTFPNFSAYRPTSRRAQCGAGTATAIHHLRYHDVPPRIHLHSITPLAAVGHLSHNTSSVAPVSHPPSARNHERISSPSTPRGLVGPPHTAVMHRPPWLRPRILGESEHLSERVQQRSSSARVARYVPLTCPPAIEQPTPNLSRSFLVSSPPCGKPVPT